MSNTRGFCIQYTRISAHVETPAGDGILEEFRLEFWACWKQLPNKGFFFVLLLAWLALFQWLGNSTLGYIPSRSLFWWMFRSYKPVPPENLKEEERPDLGDGHGLIVPFVVLALFWWKRKELLAVAMRAWWPALLLVVGGLFFHLLGYAVQQPRLSVVGLFAGIYGLMGLAWGPAFLARSFFPFCLFVFSVPLGSLAEPITFRLRLIVAQLVEIICHHLLGVDIIRAGTQLIDPTGNYQYEVAAACSGMRSLIATVGMAIILAFVSFPHWWKRVVIIASAFPLAVLANLVRMLTIIMASELFGHSAGKAVHDGGPMGVFSLLPYVPAFAGLLVIEHYLRKSNLFGSATEASKEISGPQDEKRESLVSPVPEAKEA